MTKQDGVCKHADAAIPVRSEHEIVGYINIMSVSSFAADHRRRVFQLFAVFFAEEP